MRLCELSAWCVGVGLMLTGGCHAGSAKFPWGTPSSAVKSERADVHTLNSDYRRTQSHVWVRKIDRPTRAALDYAAYHANFMIADPEPETPFVSDKPAQTAHPFAGAIDSASLTSDFAKLPLSKDELQHALAFAPLSEFLQAHHVAGAAELAAVGAAVHDEKWGLNLPPGSSGQTLSELYVQTSGTESPALWAKIEFQPWFGAFSASPDQDGDGYPEVYGRIRNGVATPELLSAIQGEYETQLLGPAEIKGWANQLSSYWYPSFNTDLMTASATFPDQQTEADIQRELHGASFSNPTIVLRGKPQGKPTYNVFLIESESSTQASPKTSSPALKLAKTKPSPTPEPVARAIESELEHLGGGSWSSWASKLAPFRDSVHRRLKTLPKSAKALAGEHGYLFYKNSLEYVAGGDLEAQRKGKNPLPIILEFKQELDRQGVDFLFVPVPTKVEVYPEELDPAVKAEGQIVNPYFRKFLLSLTRQGVEVVDLLPLFLAAKQEAGGKSGEPLFQHQDTHWTDSGLRLAAGVLAERIKKYGWYAELAKHAQPFGIKQTSFVRFGDLQSRLPEAEQKKYTPETLIAHQVIAADKQPYDDDPESPIVLLGDSFTGVYELTDAEHAGVSAHIARGVSYPLDLVMSYGGGPNVRQKLLRRGEAALHTKKLVIWLMTARDLYNYWEDWQPIKTR